MVYREHNLILKLAVLITTKLLFILYLKCLHELKRLSVTYFKVNCPLLWGTSCTATFMIFAI